VLAGPTSRQVWPHATGSSRLWSNDEAYYSSSMPTIAIVDSGIEDRADFAGRIVADVKLNGDDPSDSRGHGTFVAGIAAGAAEGYAGAAPLAPIFSIDVIDSNGAAFVSDVIRACEVILENKAAYNIRVANFSLHSAYAASVRWDPLAQAVERLWFNGVVVVASAGNYGSGDGPSGVGYAPGSDPFIITVGAGDLDPATDPSGGAWSRPRVHSTAWWSAYGYTVDGFAKPDVVAPGRYMVGPVPDGSTLASERAGSMVAPGYIQLSGTSFAAPVVAGTVAQMLARHPHLTPDQVKGALMLTARPVHGAPMGAAGVGQITASRAVTVASPPSPNAALNQFLVSSENGVYFDAEAWGEVAQADAAWASAAWGDAAWASAAWSSAAWASAAWASAAWSSAAWADAAWADAAWASAAWATGASGDGTSEHSDVTAEQVSGLADDPELAGEGEQPAVDFGGGELPAEEPPVEEPPVEEPPVEEPPAEQPPAEETWVEESPAEEAWVEEPPAEEPPAEAYTEEYTEG
jgi:serine protease AprX